MPSDIEQAKTLLGEAEALLVTAGAGMGVDSGLPDFRGTSGFWKAYSPYEALGLEFMAVANPANFHGDPSFGWGFYGHRYNLYRQTDPHRGFELLLRLGESFPSGFFVFTSNVDGHFEKAGFPENRIAECHGSINHFQCLSDCRGKIHPAEWDEFVIDPTTMRAEEPLPSCPDCGGLARPAILMFGDWEWNGNRTDEQEARYDDWLTTLGDARLAIIEIGAGTAVPTVRFESERRVRQHNAFLLRINPKEPIMPPGTDGVSLPMGGLEALRLLLDGEEV